MSTVKGLNSVLKELKSFGKEIEVDVHEITGDVATQIALDAIQKAPFNKKTGLGGDLRRGIRAIELGKADFKVMTNVTGLAPYSAYMEFGTGTTVSVPEELKEVAILFKGQGVKQINLQPQPYLYPAFVKGRKEYLKQLTKLLEKTTKKYNG